MGKLHDFFSRADRVRKKIGLEHRAVFASHLNYCRVQYGGTSDLGKTNTPSEASP